MLRALFSGVPSDVARYSLAAGLLRLARRTRVLGQAEKVIRLRKTLSYRYHLTYCNEQDPLACISHRYYLTRSMAAADRVDAALCHYTHQDQTFTDSYFDLVYHGSGLVLWRQVYEGIRYETRLEPGNDLFFEGGLSVVLYVDAQRVGVFSFSVIPAHLAFPQGPRDNRNILFICRRQLTRQRGYQTAFNRAFHRTSPSHLCIAALTGVAAALGFDTAVAITGSDQPGYMKAFHSQFEGSYDGFWTAALAGKRVSRLGYLIALPPQRPPDDHPLSEKRRRLRLRKAVTDDITQSAEQALLTRMRPAAAKG